MSDRVAHDEPLEVLAAGQASRFTRAQVRDLFPDNPGLTSSRLRSGHWRRLTSRVLALPGAPQDRIAELWTARLHVGVDAVVSHLSALVGQRLPSVPPSPPTLSVPNGSNRRAPGYVLMQRRDLGPADCTTVDGLVMTTVARSLADVASMVSPARLESWVDHALSERRCTVAELREVCERVRPRRRADLEPLTRLVADLLPGAGLEESRLERALTKAVEAAGLVPGVAQYPAPGRPGDRSGFVDRAWPDIRWVVEADGRRWHERRLAMRSDRARDRAAASVGWLVSRFMWEDLVGGPEAAARDLRDIHAARCRDIIGGPVRIG